ncbi:hypothetical protein H0H81_009783 [Sphagnurus paluster]|uniref:Uncharacterized protein n=1 Tax=Sphagnurus paluster TaxID=117069 RepID=A0A9P7FTD6_9AGAR|nr:hypothetical protein H0H81_009783 [Sphagnurus paluster]
MATTTQSPAPFSRLSRLGLGIGFKSSSASTGRARGNEKQEVEEQWYIPYHGPYEPPREPFRHQKARDSWGDPVNATDDEDDTVLTSIELHKRYDVNSHVGDHHWSGVFPKWRAGRDSGRDGLSPIRRERAHSGVSGRTVSSGFVDPNQTIMPMPRRSTVSSIQRPPVPSYVSLDIAGGVGASPVPPTHQRNASKDTNRLSLASIFTLGGRSKAPSEKSGKKSRKLSRSRPPSSIGPTTSSHRRSSSTGSQSLLGKRNTFVSSSQSEDRDDYYNSYYFSSARTTQNLVSNTSPARPTHPYKQATSSDSPKPGKSAPSPTPSAQHPYAYALSSSHHNGLNTAPLPSSDIHNKEPSTPHAETPRLTFTEPVTKPQKPASAGVVQSQFSIPHPYSLVQGNKSLKNSASTPNLGVTTITRSNSPLRRLRGLPPKPAPQFKAKDRWLSAETWCDAILFPRPRLKIKNEDSNGSSGRIVSPPSSPVQRGLAENATGNERRGQKGVASRVLAHSRSLIDLGKSRADTNADGFAPMPRLLPRLGVIPPQDEQSEPLLPHRPARPKSWALDDLDLPTPVPSLTQVLEDGEKLDTQRRQWQEQATQSFQNKVTRNISRARSKSLTYKGKRHDEPPSNIDFLAARAYLGNQLRTPIVTEKTSADSQIASHGSGAFSKGSHSHSNSLVKTLSKSSKSHSRGHSRTDSWGRSALKMAKTAATCGFTSVDAAPLARTQEELEEASQNNDTKLLNLVDAALGIPATTVTSNSPTPSGSGSMARDSRIGIALTTPPLIDNPVDRDVMRLPHPYAQGSTYDPKTPVAVGPELSSNASGNPPVIYHPYAQHTSSRDSYIPDARLVHVPRDDSDVPPPAKMWAQLSPGFVREILPDDLQYSPFISENGYEHNIDVSSRNSRVIYDTVGVGEALAYATRPQSNRDSEIGAGGEHMAIEAIQPQAFGAAAKRSYRQAVQYDTTRPPHLLLQDKKISSDPYSAHTFTSSPLLRQQSLTPDPVELEKSTSSELLGPRTISASPDSISPPHSPRYFGDPDDLDHFYDLFYKPNRPFVHQRGSSEISTASASNTPPGTRRRPGSSLATLARKLSEELDNMSALERDGGHSSMELPSSISRRPTDSTLEFVFEETPTSSLIGRSPPNQSIISPFQPSSIRIPEDVESSRASSLINPDEEDVTELFRVGIVESVTTPPPVPTDRRSSYTGELSFAEESRRPAQPIPIPRIPQTGLQPPLLDVMRSSYMTTSTGSHMSGLSDFPAPPEQHPTEDTTLLSSYFEEAQAASDEDVPHDTPSIFARSSFDDANSRDQRLTFGGEEEIHELVAALSSHSHSLTHP